MTRVQRNDYAWEPLALPSKNSAGMLRVEGYLTRSGVFSYPQPDGTVLREWRPPSEVRDATSMDSLRLVPVTIEHPTEMVTLATIKDVGVGTVGDNICAEMVSRDEPQEEDEYIEPNVRLRARLAITDAAAIAMLEDKKLREVSCGYSADLEMVTGVTPDGEAYDAIQRRITYNHLAIVETGRQGPGIAIRVDSNNKQKKEIAPMKKLILDGVSFDAPEQTIEAVTNHTKKLNDVVDGLKVKVAEEQARADGATAEAKKATAAIEAVKAQVKAGVKERVALLQTATAVMGAEAFEAANLGDAEDDALRAAVVKHVMPDADIDEKVTLALAGDAPAAAYLRASFDFAVKAGKRTDSAAPATTSTVVADSAGSVPARAAVAPVAGASAAADAARKANIEARRNAHRHTA